MLKNILLLFPLIFVTNLLAQDSLNMIRLARWDDDSLPIADPFNLRVQYSGCWGLAVNGHEYAILGGARHVLIFDITTPTSPQLVKKFEGQTNTVWREFKSYKNRVYGVSDQSNEGMMIFDFSNAPDSITRTYYSNQLFSSAHTITLDTTSGRIYLNGSSSKLKILDVSQNPDKPVLLSNLTVTGGYIHDSYVRGDTLYASSGFEGYYVYDCTNPDTAITLASLATTGGYHHNSWLSMNGRFAYCTEEIPSGRPVLVVDLQNLANANIEIVTSFLDPTMPAGMNNAIPHNVYIKGNLLFNSQYEDGLLVYDISAPLAPKLVAFYDTHPENTQYNTYFGNWGSYPWLPSGTIIAGDMQNGLQLLKLTGPVSGTQSPTLLPTVQVFPNPVSDYLTIQHLNGPSIASVQVVNMTGQVVANQLWPVAGTEVRFQVGQLSKGMYFVKMHVANGSVISKKVVIK
ncbi:MAG: choice-of-anchor B family protein [Saprospiraceae bacterium]